MVYIVRHPIHMNNVTMKFLFHCDGGCMYNYCHIISFRTGLLAYFTMHSANEIMPINQCEEPIYIVEVACCIYKKINDKPKLCFQ